MSDWKHDQDLAPRGKEKKISGFTCRNNLPASSLSHISVKEQGWNKKSVMHHKWIFSTTII